MEIQGFILKWNELGVASVPDDESIIPVSEYHIPAFKVNFSGLFMEGDNTYRQQIVSASVRVLLRERRNQYNSLSM